MPPTMQDLFNHQTELWYFILIMQGMCTAALCLTLVWGIETISGALKALKPQPVIHRYEARRSNEAQRNYGKIARNLLPDLSNTHYIMQ
jgi:hypothetical protein